MSEYRAVIGSFAGVAAKAGQGRKKKWKERKREKRRNIEKKEEMMVKMPDQVKHSKRSRSLKIRKGRDESIDIGQRSKSLNQKGKIRSVANRPRTKSQCPVLIRKEKNMIADDNFKNACTACKTEMFDRNWQRGRARETSKENVCPHMDKKRRALESNQLKLFTCLALSTWFMLERAMLAVVQMLLIRSGIETNPGPAHEVRIPEVKIPADSDKSRWSVIGSALHSIYKSIPVYLQKVLKDHLDNQPR